MKKLTLMLMVAGMCLTLLLAGCGNDNPAADSNSTVKVELKISAAASLTDAIKAINKEYEQANPDVKISANFAGSGALQSQIEQGAPVDVFISAAQKQMKALQSKGLILEDSKKDLLVNDVVVIAAKNSNIQLASLKDLTADNIKKIGVGDPKSVPVGQYTAEIFKNLKIADAVKGKEVYGSDVRQVLAWVENDEVNVGLVYATDAAISDKVKVLATAPEDSHKPVVYPVGIIKDSHNIEAAKKYEDFLFSPKAKEIFTKYGFTVK